MSNSNICLVLRLEGPLQSWGVRSQYNYRTTGILPSKSAVAGMCCAALGLDRGSEEEKVFLQQFAAVRMLTVALPRFCKEKLLSVHRLEDYHTIQDTITAKGKKKDCHITRRQYLLDASFRVFLNGELTFLKQVGAALQDPVWGIWLGRKCCIPSAPVFAGFFDDESSAVANCLPKSLSDYIHSREVFSFAEGNDSVADMPLSFSSSARTFTLRRIKVCYGGS